MHFFFIVSIPLLIAFYEKREGKKDNNENDKKAKGKEEQG